MLNERRKLISEYIEAHGEANNEDLMKLCSGCSAMTLWRDLKKLDEEGLIRRKRGGAISIRLVNVQGEDVYAQRELVNPRSKKIIAKMASEYVKFESSIFLDAGSTIMSIAKQMPDQHYNIVTSGTNIATELSRRSKCNVTLIGGQVNGNTLSCSGPQAEAFLDSLNIDTAIMATSGFSLDNGFTSGSFNEHQLKRKVIEKARQVIMLMDLSKIDHSMPYTFATLQDIHVLICDAPLPDEVRKEAERFGVEVLTGPA